MGQRVQQGLNRGMNMVFNQFMGGGMGMGGIQNLFGGMQQMMDPNQGPPPTANDTISNLPQYTFQGGKGKGNDSDSDEDGDAAVTVTESEDEGVDGDEKESDDRNSDCAVCKERFAKGDVLIDLPCGHR